MKNEDKEKAKEFANRFVNEERKDGAEQGALWMARWKDQQFKEYLEQRKANADKEGDALSYLLIDEIITELFGE